MRLAVDASCLAWPNAGGIQRYLRQVLTHLARRDDLHIELLVNANRPLDGFAGCEQIARRVPGGVAWRAAVVTRHLLRRRPDVFWAPRLPAPLVVPCPFVLTLHDLAPAILRGSKPPLEDAAFRTTFPWVARRADRVICVSSRTRDDAVQRWGIAPQRTTVIPLGVAARFTPGSRPEASRAVSDAFGITRPYVLFVGSIEVRKGLETIVATAEASRDGELDFVMAGATGYGSEPIIERARATGICHLLGYVGDDDLVSLYRAAEVLVLPSLYEGFGLTAIEAMACGTPVAVAADSGSLPEVFGTAATVVAERTVAAWHAAIELSRADRSRLAAAGAALAARHDWATAASATLEVLSAAAGAA